MRPILSVVIALVLAAGAHAALKSDIEFARPGGQPLTLDAWVPDGPGPFPTVIVVHGGGWRNGDKQTYVPPLFPPLTEAGFAWFTINYRLAPAHHFPAPVDDVIGAVQWVKAHAREYKVDTRRLAIIGESAGGHLVAFVGARDGKRLGLAAIVPFYAPCDLDPLTAIPDRPRAGLQALLGFEELDEAAHRKLARGLAGHLRRQGHAAVSDDPRDRRSDGALCAVRHHVRPHKEGGWRMRTLSRGGRAPRRGWLGKEPRLPGLQTQDGRVAQSRHEVK